jgi:hypothetical protein
MKRTNLLLVVILLAGLTSISAASAPEPLWQKTYGEGWNGTLISLLEPPDGYLLVGSEHRETTGMEELHLVWTDDRGSAVKEISSPFGIGGVGGANMASLTSDQGIIAVGQTRSVTAGDEDVCLLRLKADGTTLWSRSYTIGSGVDIGYAVRPATDGGFMVAGTTTSQSGGTPGLLLLKVDDAGGQLWHRTHSLGANRLSVHDLHATPDGGYLLVGSTDADHRGSLDILLVKLTASGTREWQQTYSFGARLAIGYTLEPSPDGGYMILGGVEGSASSEAVMLRVDTSGREVRRSFLALDRASVRAYDLVSVTGSGFVVVGETDTSGSPRLFVAGVDRTGRELWNGTYAIGTGADRGLAVTEGGDGYVVAGEAAPSRSGPSDLFLAAIPRPTIAPNMTAVETVNATPHVTATANATVPKTPIVTPTSIASPSTSAPDPTRSPLGATLVVLALGLASLLAAVRSAR